MPSVKLYNTKLGKLADYEVSIDRNGDIVCEYGNDSDHYEVIKFPGGQTKAQFQKLVKQHNDANEGQKQIDLKAQEARDKKNEDLLEALS